MPTDEVVLVGDGFPAQMLYHLVIIPLRKSSKATQKHIASKSLISVQSGRVWVNLNF